MTEQQTNHAKKVVNRFRKMVGKAGSEQLGDDHWDELVLLVESAIDTAVLDAEEKICSTLETVVGSIRSDAERFDRP